MAQLFGLLGTIVGTTLVWGSGYSEVAKFVTAASVGATAAITVLRFLR